MGRRCLRSRVALIPDVCCLAPSQAVRRASGEGAPDRDGLPRTGLGPARPERWVGAQPSAGVVYGRDGSLLGQSTAPPQDRGIDDAGAVGVMRCSPSWQFLQELQGLQGLRGLVPLASSSS